MRQGRPYTVGGKIHQRIAIYPRTYEVLRRVSDEHNELMINVVDKAVRLYEELGRPEFQGETNQEKS